MKDPLLAQHVVELTSFLRGGNNCLKTRLHVLLQGITTQPTCKQCGNDVYMRLDGRYRYTFPTYCSSMCLSSAPEVKSKRLSTNLKKYGAPNPSQTQEVREKFKHTMMERYGVENAMLSDTLRDKVKQTNLDRYGTEYAASAPENIEKRKKTNLSRYGNENAGASSENIEKRKKTCMLKYGVENPFELPAFQAKAGDTMMERYGVRHPYQSADILAKFKQHMVSTYGHTHFHTSQISEEITNCTSNIEFWNKSIADQIPLSVLQATLGVGRTFLLSECSKLGVEYPSFGGTSYGERTLAEYITATYGGTVLTNVRNVINPLELDVYLPDLNLAFEFNGVFWHGETQGKHRTYHLNKLKQCNNQGVRLVQITDVEWYSKNEIVKSRISSFLHNNSTIYARKTTIRHMSSTESSTFFKHNHIQGTSGQSVCYGLIINDKIVAAMSFGKARYNKTVDWELLRYANTLNTTVVGGASKLFKHFVQEHRPNSIITYSDKRWNTGSVYSSLGFKYSHTAPPNYYYFQPSDTTKLHHRSQFQKHKLEKKLDTFDPNLTEWQNMQINGYDRIWDCGNDVYVWSRLDI